MRYLHPIAWENDIPLTQKETTVAHMTPHYENTTKWTLTKPNGEDTLFDELTDATCAIDDDKEFAPGESYTVTCEKGWWARLSANGYLDCTDWGGPFASEELARDYIADTYDVDADSGEPLAEDDDYWHGGDRTNAATGTENSSGHE